MRVTSLRSVFVGAAIAVLSAVALGQDMLQQQASDLAGEWEMVIPRSERFYRSGT